jgi:hypothetical protein
MQAGDEEQAASSSTLPRVVTSFACIPQIIPKIPNYQLFHNLLVYKQGGLCTPQEMAGIEQRVVEDHWSRYKKGYTAGIRTYYAPDERMCRISRDIMDIDLLVPCIEKVCVGVMNAWKLCPVGSDCAVPACFSESDQKECMDMGRKMCSCINMTIRDTFLRLFSRVAAPDDALPLLAVDTLLCCDVQRLLQWFSSVLKWIQERYANFPSLDGLLLYRKQEGVKDLTQDRDLLVFKDTMTHLIVYRLERISECVMDVENELDLWKIHATCVAGESPDGDATPCKQTPGGRYADDSDNISEGSESATQCSVRRRVADAYNKYLYRACKFLTVLQMDAINRAIAFYEPAVVRHALPYVKQCLLQRPPENLHTSNEVITLLG